MTDDEGVGPAMYPVGSGPPAGGPHPAGWLEPDPDPSSAAGDSPSSGPPPPEPSRWWNGALVIIAVALLGVGVALFVGARQASSDASDARSQAATMEGSRLALDVQQNGLDDHRRAIESAQSDLDRAMETLTTALRTAAAAQRHLIDVDDRAVVLSNQGNRSGATALVKSDGAAALADLDQKTAAASKAVVDAQAAVQQLQAKIDG